MCISIGYGVLDFPRAHLPVQAFFHQQRIWQKNIQKNFEYKWVATSGRHDFEVVAYVVDGEEITDNNNLTKSISIEVETSTGLLPNLSFGIIVSSIIFVSYFSRRKPN